MNHIGDDTFMMIHAVNIFLLFSDLFAVWRLWNVSKTWRLFAVGSTLVNLAAWLAFIYMHATGMLVTYTEFIRHSMGK